MELTRARIVTFAMMFGVALFTGVAYVLVTAGNMSSVLPGSMKYLLMGLFIVGLVVMAGAPNFARRVVGKAAKPGVNAYFVEVVIRNAIREAVGITGIVLSILSANLQGIVGFGVACVLGIAMGWPREEEMKEAERRIRR
jgi:hypothetical protein